MTGIDPVYLAHAHTDTGAPFDEQDGVGLDGADGPPRKAEVSQRRSVGRVSANEPPARWVITAGLTLDDRVDLVAGLHQDSATDRTEVDLVATVHALGQFQETNCLLALKDLQRLGVKGRGDHDLGEHRSNLLRHRCCDGTVGRDDSAVCRLRVAGVSKPVGLGDVASNRDPAGVGVLDDGHGRFGVVVRRTLGHIGINVVVVGHLLAVQLLGRGDPRTPVGIKRCLLVRVLAVAKDVSPRPRRAYPRREAGAVAGVGQNAAHPACDGKVVASRVHERFRRKGLALVESETAATYRNQHRTVFRRICHDRHARVVLGRGPHHRGPTDVDLLYALFLGGT